MVIPIVVEEGIKLVLLVLSSLYCESLLSLMICTAASHDVRAVCTVVSYLPTHLRGGDNW